MRSVATIVGLVIVLAVGYVVYERDLARTDSLQAPPQQQIDLVGIQSDLIAIARAERQYLATHGTYASLDQLQADGLVPFSGAGRRGYTFASDVDGSRRFTITATPSEAGWPTLSIDETLNVSRR